MEANSMSTDTQVCINCQKLSTSTELYCTRCGYILPNTLKDAQSTVSVSEADKPIVDLQWGTGYFHYRAKLYLHLEESQGHRSLEVVEIPLRRSSAVLGRGTDEDEERVDLSPLGALELGVSRRHARIDLRGDILQITDLDSFNGTYLNRARLIPNSPYTLRNRAVLQLSHMILRVQFG